MKEMLANLGSAIAGLMFAWAMFRQYFPHQLQDFLEKHGQKFLSLVYPYIHITFQEFIGDEFWYTRSEAYSNIQNYLRVNSTASAKRLKANVVKDSQSLVLGMDDREEVADEFNGIKVWWQSIKDSPKSQRISFYPQDDEKRHYTLKFHRRHRDIITKNYIDHVMKEGKKLGVKNRQRKLYSNNPSKNWSFWRSNKWAEVLFEHPATFDTLAMATKAKDEIVKDLIKFSKSKDYYARIGKPWKPGYLLYGPPGTGKSTMIAAMANLLDYDIYDLELTTVKDNSELRRLLIETTSKSIIVIEDIDCSLDLTGQREKKKEKDEKEDEKDPMSTKKKMEEGESSKVTLSGLLNSIDGLWSACGAERIMVFTTNYVDKLDRALIRRGRMDKHIEMSYCCFEAFKMLAKNYLDIEWHQLFPKIEKLLEETNMIPADVAENLMPKADDEDEETCLKKLIEALEASKEEDRKKAEEEAKLKAEEEAKLKAEQEEKEREKEKKKEDKNPEEVKVNEAATDAEVKEKSDK